MSKLNLRTLAANAARAKKRLLLQEKRVQDLSAQLVQRVGTGGRTFATSMGQVIVTAETTDRTGQGFILQFDAEKFNELDPVLQLQLTQAGVVSPKKVMIKGQAPKVQYRINV